MTKIIISALMLVFCSILLSQNIYIGVYISEIDKPTMIKHHLKGGVRIDSVLQDSPAEKAGLRKNHIICKIDDQLITNESDFQRVLASYKPNDRILFTVKTNKRTQIYTINAQNRSALLKDLYIYNYIQNPWLFIGIDVQKMDEQLSEYFKHNKGLVIVDIREHSLALTNGLKVGDIITHVNSNVVQTEDDLSKQLAWGIKKQPIVLDVIRKQKHIKVNLNLTNNKIRDFKNKSDEVYIIGPDIYDSELYIYSQGKINQILKQSDTEIESEIQRLESEIQGLKKRIRNK